MMKRRDLIVYLTAKNCNPNGDMNNDNMPRQDFESGYGLMSDVSNKRRVKSAVAQIYEVPMLVDPSLVSIEAKAKEAISDIDDAALAEMTPLDRDKAVKQSICKKYWDARTFGATVANLSKKDKSLSDGAIVGPVAFTWAESLAPVTVDQPEVITRCNAATDADLAKGKTHDVGTKWRLGFAQYAYEVHVSGARGETWTGFNDDDYAMLLEGIKKSWMLNQTSSKTGMEVDAIVEFTHESVFGNASPSALRECVRLDEVTSSDGKVKYVPRIDESMVPSGVTAKIYR
jgi:Cas7 group CRISPR-associated protein Csh2